jgi:ketosteroid isomerase-like protein
MKGAMMKTKRTAPKAGILIYLILSSMIVFWGSQASGEEWTEAQKEVWKSLEDDWKLIKQGDLEARMANLPDYCSSWWSDRAFPLNKKRLREGYATWFAYGGVESYELKPFDIQIVGNVAIVYYLWQWKGSSGSGSGRQTSTWIKQEGKWRFMGGMSANCEKLPVCFH